MGGRPESAPPTSGPGRVRKATDMQRSDRRSGAGIAPAAAVVAVAAAYSIALLVGAADPTGVSSVIDLAPVVVGAGAAALAWRSATRWAGDSNVASAWRAVAGALAAWAVGDLFWWAARTTPSVSPTLDALASLAFLAFYPLAMIGVLRFSERPLTSSERVRFVLDVASVFVAAFVAIAVLVRPWEMPASAPVEMLLRVGCPAGDALIIVALVLTVLRWPAGTPLAPVALLCAGFTLLLAGDVLSGADAAGTVPVPAGVPGALAVAGAAVAACAAVAQVRPRSTSRRHPAPDDRVRALVAVLPITVVLVGLVVVLLTEGSALDPGTQVLLAGGIVLVAFAAIGQALAHRESAAARAAETRVSAQARFRTVVESASDVIVTLTPSGRIVNATPSLARLTGWEPSDSIGVSFLDRVHSEDRSRVSRAVLGERPHGRTGPLVVEFRMMRRDDSWVDVESSVADLRDDPTVCGIVLAIRDIGERKLAESDLRRQAFHDQLTGLPNRAHFLDRTEHALARAARTGDPVHVLYLDLDGFKRINDSLGHDAGDRVLRVVAERLTWAVRAGDTLARLGGDEFAVLLEDRATADAARGVAERVQDAVATPIDVEGRHVRVGVCVGIASPATVVGTAAERDDWSLGRAAMADELIRNADVAMYEAKQRGKGRVSVYEPAMRLAAVTRLDLETALREAVEREEFVVHFQPIADLTTGSVVGMEALVRWDRPGAGLVSPAGFIAVAEETGLIRAIGAQVLRASCIAAGRWTGGRDAIDLSVNISARQLQDPLFIDVVRRVLAETAVDPARLVFEITESSLIEDGPAALDQLALIRTLGIRFAIDDFGTGYSSLGYLEQLPVDILKIDRTFVVDLATSPKRAALLRAIVGMAGALHLTTVAEGIETEQQLRLVRDIGCDLGQGFLLARPLPADKAGAILEQDRATGGTFRGLIRGAGADHPTSARRS